MREDTIAAIASPIAEGGIGIIRISGEDAYAVLSKIFCSVKKHISSCNENLSEDCEGRKKELFLPQATSETVGLKLENRRLSYGFITDYKTGQKIDEVLAVYMKAPYTYTREDIVEIYCHGSVVALRKTLGLVLQNGARLAEPGEFTKRAFLNGRLDLSQAEAVIDLIKAKTDTGFDAAMSQLEGELSREVNRIRSLIMDVLVQITVNIDYPDEDIEEITYQGLMESLSQISDEIAKLLLGADTGRIIKEGLKVAIIGKPNVGKSSLMNRLLKENRAIVTEVPGTTRDTIEESLSIKNILVSLTDTAGIRDTDDKVEQIGIERSKAAANRADLVILVVDGSDQLTEEDKEIMTAVAGRKLIAVLNKRDKGDVVTADDIRTVIPRAQVIEASAEAGTGISEIEDAVENLVYEGGVKPGESALVTNARHEDLMRRAKDFTDDAMSAAEMSEPLDIIEIDVKEAYSCLGEIVGETVSDDIINEVFSRFCLGK
ncbi:MAG: tRNA uridine-5-carboxymethylaminomethyl(34) synthesis GTPase MnmE [Firmicutes bacterium]|nr:tRNA uridine-5-carboxymethylaminomethyl(34) synthesis GTPase MnmE [Bacillota bacterium]